jgi:DNA-binding transcriptional MerR regulator
MAELTIGQVVANAGLRTSAIRYYEAKGTASAAASAVGKARL